ncbi:MAG: FprA family A-type flavoprotein [Thermoplasmatales archaeon]|nr:FprA family A-type flavoprotein [Thermoplasmatales archaeon]
MIEEIKKDIYFVGAIDWHRRLFDELIPLPDGTTYNSYLIKDEKIVLIDTVDPSKERELVENLNELVGRVDYIVANHAEQDHSGAIPAILSIYKEAKVLTNEKCKEFLKDLLLIPDERFITVEDGQEISIGKRKLKFLLTPWVHWPETMLTYAKEDKILFTCDLFGSHLATSNIFSKDEKLYSSAKRYYAEIMMPFRNKIKEYISKIEKMEIDIIAPSHGPIYKEKDFILNAYKEWVSDKVRKEVVIAYVSMHGSVEKAVSYLIDELVKRKIEVRPFNLSKTDIGELAISLVDCSTLIVASPTVLGGLHPLVLYALYLASLLRPKLKFVSFIGSYSWGSNALAQLNEIIGKMKVEVIEPLIMKGHPKEKDFERIREMAEEIEKRHSKL